MTGNKVMRWVAGTVAAALAVVVIGCEDEKEDDISSNPAIPQGVRITRSEEQFVWKFQPRGYRCEGKRLITRWPSYLYFNYGLRGDNSYVKAGRFRLEFYRYDEDGTRGMKASYAVCGSSASDFTANQRVILYKDGRPFAFAVVPNPAVPYVAPLP